MQGRTHNCGQLRLENADEKVTLVGWFENIRKVSKNLGFVILRDFYGTTQIVVETEDLMEQFSAINPESTIEVTGTVRERSSKNPKLATGDIEVVPETVKVLGKCQYQELPFQIKYMEITEAEQTFELNGYRLKAFRVNHNVTCYGYTMEIDRAGKFDVERAKASNIPQEYWGLLQKGETIETKRHVYTPDMVLGPARKGIKLTYTTDTRPTESIKQNAKHSDLFICEGMYGEKDKQKKAKEYKHMTFYEAAQLAKEAEVKEMWLTHYSPSLTKPEEYMDDVKAIFPNSIAAKDKRSVELVFED